MFTVFCKSAEFDELLSVVDEMRLDFVPVSGKSGLYIYPDNEDQIGELQNKLENIGVSIDVNVGL